MKRLQSAGWSTLLCRSAMLQPASIVVCPILQRAEQGRESLNPAEMKLCPGFHNPFASSKCTLLKKVLAGVLGLFYVRGIVPPLPPRYTPASTTQHCTQNSPKDFTTTCALLNAQCHAILIDAGCELPRTHSRLTDLTPRFVWLPHINTISKLEPHVSSKVLTVVSCWKREEESIRNLYFYRYYLWNKISPNSVQPSLFGFCVSVLIFSRSLSISSKGQDGSGSCISDDWLFSCGTGDATCAWTVWNVWNFNTLTTWESSRYKYNRNHLFKALRLDAW